MPIRNIDILEQLLEELTPAVRRAFIEAIQDLVDPANVKINRIAELLRAGDVDGVIRYLGIDRLKFQGLDLAIREVFETAGAQTAARIPTLVKVVFDVRNFAAESWLRNHSSQLITSIVDDQRDMIRGFLTDGMEAGNNPRTTALNLVGTINRTTGRREGGVIGLTDAQEAWQRNYASEIASTDPVELRKALGRNLRDKRFDGSVRRAIRTGEPIPAATRAKMLAAYRNRMLKYRADVVSRTETLSGIQAAQYEAYRQAIGRGELDAENVTKIWDSAGDLRVRNSHRILDEQQKAFNEPFRSPLGSLMRYPTDTSMGARAGDVIGCRCVVRYRIKF